MGLHGRSHCGLGLLHRTSGYLTRKARSVGLKRDKGTEWAVGYARSGPISISICQERRESWTVKLPASGSGAIESLKVP